MNYNLSKVRVSDIPQEGLELNFELSSELLLNRINEPISDYSESNLIPPSIKLTAPVKASVKLESDGQTVDMKGDIASNYISLCGRCGEEAKADIFSEVSLIFKPKKNSDEFDDVGFVLYKGDVLDCSEALEELFILSIPHTIYCSENCLGLCPNCGVNLNNSKCLCREKGVSLNSKNNDSAESEVVNTPFSKLKDYLS